jgi:hypothetical protein
MNLQKIIDDALKVAHTECHPIENFTIESLIDLSAIAKKNKVELRIRKETSNFYQGTLLEVQRMQNRIDCNRGEITYET